LRFHGPAQNSGTDGSVDATDSDADGHATFQEWLADTDPTNALFFFHIEDISRQSPVAVSFQSSSNRTYTLCSTPKLAPPDWTPVPGEQAISGTGGTMTLGDPITAPRLFYGVRVGLASTATVAINGYACHQTRPRTNAARPSGI